MTVVATKALVMYQPWASLLVAGVKKFETRPARTLIRGRVGIYAAKGRQYVDDPEIDRDLERIMEAHFGAVWRDVIPYGAVIGTVAIDGCHEMTRPLIEKLGCKGASEELTMGNWQVGRWAWNIVQPRPLAQPLIVKGHQGWINVNIEE